jgi:predicted ferric reductase
MVFTYQTYNYDTTHSADLIQYAATTNGNKNLQISLSTEYNEDDITFALRHLKSSPDFTIVYMCKPCLMKALRLILDNNKNSIIKFKETKEVACCGILFPSN